MTIENEVFDYWVKTMNKNSLAKLTNGRKAKIKARYKEGYSLEEMKQGIDGCASSGFHMGDNPSGKVYNGLELILKSGEDLERFIGYTTRVMHIPEFTNRKTRDISPEQRLNDRSWAEGLTSTKTRDRSIRDEMNDTSW